VSTKPRCLVYNPYFPVLGGGERYSVALGEVIAESHDVTYASIHGLDPARVAEVGFPSIEVQELRLRDFPRTTLDYDLVVLPALYAPPPTFARRSVLVVQFPRLRPTRNPMRRFVRRMRMRRYHAVVYSRFAQDWLQKRWGVRGDVLYPPVELAERVSGAKANLIVSVGRFVGFAADQWNNKRQDALIDAFAALPEEVRASWHLALAGVAMTSSIAGLFIMASRFSRDSNWRSWVRPTQLVAVCAIVFVVIYAVWSTKATGFAGVFERLAILASPVWALAFARRLGTGVPFMISPSQR